MTAIRCCPVQSFFVFPRLIYGSGTNRSLSVSRHISSKCSAMFLGRSPGVGVWPLTRGLVGYIIAPTFATFTLSFDNCLPKLWASLYRQLAAMHICCIFLLKIWLLTCYIIMVLYFVSTIIKWPLSTITLCVFCSKLAQGSASMCYIHIEHQQGINEYFDRPVKIVFIQCDVKLICLLICVRQHCNPEAE